MILKRHTKYYAVMRVYLTLLYSFFTILSFASEGMWLLPNIPDAVIEKMEDGGMEFDIDAVYSEKSASLKDATVYLTSGYTGTIISDKGLLIAPYDAVRNNLPESVSVDSGYTSPSIFKEVPLGNLSAWILQGTKDVTYQVTSQLQNVTDEDAIAHKVDSISRAICSAIVLPSGHRANVTKTSTGGYYLYQYKCFSDVRLAYLPPRGIANDSLKKERHSADFVILRIYADRSNEPAYYDNSNKIYEPGFSAVISKNGYEESDFVMALGYPNKSNRRVLSADIIEKSVTKPEAQVEALSFIDSTGYKSMSSQIAERQSAVAMVKGSGIIESKVKDETKFIVWAANSTDFDAVLRYTNLIPKINAKYDARRTYVSQYEIVNTLFKNVETLNTADHLIDWNDENEEEVFAVLNDYFVGMNAEKEKQMLVKTLSYLEANVDSALIAPAFEVEKSKKYKGNREKYIIDIFSKSLITDEKRFLKFLDIPSKSVLLEDPLMSLVSKLSETRKYLYVLANLDSKEVATMTRLYKEGQALANPSQQTTPDANYSLRLSYGKVAGYAKDDVHYVKAVSKLGGIFSHSYLAPKSGVDSLMTSLYETVPSAKQLRITFLTDCDMATGRMGYGVYDNNGELLGIVTSSNAEALNNTYLYDALYQRLVVLDMNYVAFVLDKYAQSGYIFDELKFGDVEKVVKIKEVPKAVNHTETGESEEAENID